MKTKQLFFWKRAQGLLLMACAALTLAACSEMEPLAPEDFDKESVAGRLFVVNQGNFGYSNASLSLYNPETKTVENEVFARANAIPLGDVAQSIAVHGKTAWVVVNGSGAVYALDTKSYREKGNIEGLTSPRYVHFVSDTKGYITQLWDPRIVIFNPQTYEVTGAIETGMEAANASTEQMVPWGDKLFVNCWSNQRSILVIDTATDRIERTIEVGPQPTSMVLDRHDKLWVLTDGGYEGHPMGWYEAPALTRIDAATGAVEQTFTFTKGDWVTGLCTDGAGENIYLINNGLYKFSATDTEFPAEPLIRFEQSFYSAVTIDPETSEIYLADAIDYVQPGMIHRYSPAGELLDQFSVGVTPAAFCWF